MRQMRIDKQELWYALYKGQEEQLATDEEGNIIYDDIDGEQVPRTTGHWVQTYYTPVKFYGNINSGNVGEAVARSYGLSLASGEAVLCMRKGELPIDEQTLIWYQNKPDVVYAPLTIIAQNGMALVNSDGEDLQTSQDFACFDPNTADYRVKRVPPCLDEIIYLLGRLDNNASS